MWLTNLVVSVPWYCSSHDLPTNEAIQVGAAINPTGLCGGDGLYVYDEETRHAEMTRLPRSSAFWSPTAFAAVPEPSSGLLALLGMALLALLRRK